MFITSHTFAQSAPYRDDLIAALHQTGALQSLPVWHAFMTIPREIFVPFFYERDETQPSGDWKRIDAVLLGTRPYLHSVYRDRMLVTAIDARQRPGSVSARPSTIARMLEALDLHPGHRVLEVGTGNGYITALLSMLAGNPVYVSSIERDEQRQQQARQALSQVIGSIKLLTSETDTRNVLYDRILLTTSSAQVPHAVVRQLAPGGRLVMDLCGSLHASGFLVLENMPEGLIGSFRADPLHLTPMVDQPSVVSSTSGRQPLHALASQKVIFLPVDHAYPAIITQAAFRWFLQWSFPGCHLSCQTCIAERKSTPLTAFDLVAAHQRARLRFRQADAHALWQVHVDGSDQWWQQVQGAAEQFRALGEPQPRQYQLVIEGEQVRMMVGSYSVPMKPG